VANQAIARMKHAHRVLKADLDEQLFGERLHGVL
jgi:hypothetical protein